ncbi:MAG: hypothetical protein WBB01_22225 [Phormidesmis sp.]
MASSPSSTARFRSATDFPQSIQELERSQGEAIYEEMRDCLIFTNRSRAQLVRRNSEHKDKTLELRAKVGHFQELINQLQSQKQVQLQQKADLIDQLAAEMAEMHSQMGLLSEAFEAVGDPESEMQQHWGLISFPQRFMRLIKAVKSLMQWWHSQDDSQDRLAEGSPVVITDAEAEDEQDRRDRPQLYSDQASINRSLLDP